MRLHDDHERPDGRAEDGRAEDGCTKDGCIDDGRAANGHTGGDAIDRQDDTTDARGADARAAMLARREEIRRRFPMVLFAVEHFGGEPIGDGADVRLAGAGLGGFRINEARGVWRHDRANLGGDVFDLVGYALDGPEYFTDKTRHFRRAFLHAAAIVDALPKTTDATAPRLERRERAAYPRPVLGASGIDTDAAHAPSEHAPAQPKRVYRTLVAVYNYFDEASHPLFQVRRYTPKHFMMRRRGPDGAWAYGLGAGWYRRHGKVWFRVPANEVLDDTTGMVTSPQLSDSGPPSRDVSTSDALAHEAPTPSAVWLDAVRLVPYRLPEVRTAIEYGMLVFLCEGEKDCDALWMLGAVATTNPFGALKWRPEYTPLLAGADVAILPHRNELGERHAAQVAAALHATARSVRVVRLPELPVGGDVDDWLRRGGTLGELFDRTAATPLYEGHDDGRDDTVRGDGGGAPR